MGCAISMVKYLLFIFNFIFAVIGIAILGVGVWVYLAINDYEKASDMISSPAIAFIVIGVIVFVIAFFGCCGAVRENHCMVITYAILLLTILIIQIAIGVWAFLLGKDVQTDETLQQITDIYRNDIFVNYWTDSTDRSIVDTAQTGFSCCGVISYTDFNGLAGANNNTIPWSCCGNAVDVSCTTTNVFTTGCVSKLAGFLESLAKVMGGVLIGVAATELVGIIFALCLANSIRNDDRRGYRV